MAEKPRPLLEVWRQLNRERDRGPSVLAQQMREAGEGLRRFAAQSHIRKLGERLRRLQERQLIERTMESPRKRKPGAGRKPILTLEQIEDGTRLLRSRPKTTVLAACSELRAAGIKGKDTILYEQIVKPAYSSHFHIMVPTAQLRRRKGR